MVPVNLDISPYKSDDMVPVNLDDMEPNNLDTSPHNFGDMVPVNPGDMVPVNPDISPDNFGDTEPYNLDTLHHNVFEITVNVMMQSCDTIVNVYLFFII